MLEAIRRLEIIECFVEHKERLGADSSQTLLQARIQGIQPFIERFQVALVTSRIGWVDAAKVSSHLCRNDPGIDR
ncbi:hypothetical protein D3C77_609020 [compost metagenome]